jgi:Dynein heavy chain, N-terminal region 2
MTFQSSSGGAQARGGLGEYVAAKRAVFPRLHFLADNELLQLLSSAAEPSSVPLQRLFPGISKLAVLKQGYGAVRTWLRCLLSCC